MLFIFLFFLGKGEYKNDSNFSLPSLSNLSVERLGRPGAQTGVALAHLLGGQKPLSLTPGSLRFERGLGALESFVVNYGDRRVPSLFEKGVIVSYIYIN